MPRYWLSCFQKASNWFLLLSFILHIGMLQLVSFYGATQLAGPFGSSRSSAFPFCNLSFLSAMTSTDYILRCIWHQFTVSSQGNLQHEYAGSDSVLLDGPEVRQELISLLGYLKLCMYFSKKPYNVFLEFGGYDQNDVLIKKSKARVRKYQSSLYCQLCIEVFQEKLCIESWDLDVPWAFIPVLN